MKTKITLIGLSFLFSLQTFSQAPSWLWAKSGGGTSSEIVYSVATDVSGNVIAVGFFQSATLTFGSTTLTNAGNKDMFVVKYDAAGNVLWAISAGGTLNDIAYSVTTDDSGNIIIAGYFASATITFGSTILTNVGSSSYDMVVVKCDAAGNVLWARSAGGTGSVLANSVTADASGNVIATGYFTTATLTFGSTTLTNTVNLYEDIFIVKYNAAGTVLWAKSAGGTTDDVASSVAADASGNIIVSGYFDSNTLSFGSISVANVALYDMFVVKYDSTGTVLWARSAGGFSGDQAFSVTADASGNIIAAGHFISGTITFDTTTLSNAGGYDMFIVKYDAAGTVLWANSAGGNSSDKINCVTADAYGNIIAAGYFDSDTLTFGSTTLTSTSRDMFIVNYNAAGNVLWALSAGGTADDEANSVTADASGDIIVAGDFASPTLIFGSTTLTNAGIYDMFLGKLDVLTSINEMTNDESQISIFPNPAATEVTLNFGKEAQHEVQLINTLGEILFLTTTSAEQMKIDLRDFPKGIYIFTVRDENKIMVVRKILKM